MEAVSLPPGNLKESLGTGSPVIFHVAWGTCHSKEPEVGGRDQALLWPRRGMKTGASEAARGQKAPVWPEGKAAGENESEPHLHLCWVPR